MDPLVSALEKLLNQSYLFFRTTRYKKIVSKAVLDIVPNNDKVAQANMLLLVMKAGLKLKHLDKTEEWLNDLFLYIVSAQDETVLKESKLGWFLSSFLSQREYNKNNVSVAIGCLPRLMQTEGSLQGYEDLLRIIKASKSTLKEEAGLNLFTQMLASSTNTLDLLNLHEKEKVGWKKNLIWSRVEELRRAHLKEPA